MDILVHFMLQQPTKPCREDCVHEDFVVLLSHSNKHRFGFSILLSLERHQLRIDCFKLLSCVLGLILAGRETHDACFSACLPTLVHFHSLMYLLPRFNDALLQNLLSWTGLASLEASRNLLRITSFERPAYLCCSGDHQLQLQHKVLEGFSG